MTKHDWNSPQIKWSYPELWVVPLVVIHLHTELVSSIKTTGIMINRLRNYGSLSQAICVIVKYFGKLLLKTIFQPLILPDFLFMKTIHENSIIWNCTVYLKQYNSISYITKLSGYPFMSVAMYVGHASNNLPMSIGEGRSEMGTLKFFTPAACLW